MAAGDGFTSSQRAAIDRAVRDAETQSRLEFSLYVGAADGESRPFAERLHSTLTAPAKSVLVMVDPAARLLEVVTGTTARGVLNDQQVRLAVAAMQSAFAEGDLVGGLTRGVAMLADQARKPEVLHTD